MNKEKRSWKIMPMDYYYWYDFSSQIPVTDLTECQEGDLFSYYGKAVLPEAGEYILLLPTFDLCVSVNDTAVCECEMSRSLYYGKKCGKQGVKLVLSEGENKIKVTLRKQYDANYLNLTLVPDFAPVQKTEPFVMPLSVEEKSLDLPAENSVFKTDEWQEGAGHGASPGRFGFSKGDGLLDCAMTSFGLVDKLYLVGHPRYDKPYRWGYCVLPGKEKAVLDGDHFEVNQLCVKWESQNVSLQYSLATPGIITECKDQDMRLSQLEYAGDYRYIMTAGSICTPEEFTPDMMTENFLLLFGSRVFPDVPILVSLDKKPQKVSVERYKGRLSALTFHGCRRMITGTPFGMESLESRDPSDKAFLTDALSRCRLWSRAFLAFPCDCKEYFRIDEEAQKCHILQNFSYRMLQDEWNTEPLFLASFPPAAALSTVAEWKEAADLEFPTKYGPLYAVKGKSNSYTLPLLPYRSKFPLKDKKGNAASLLKKGMKEYFDFQSQFSVDTASYAYFGSTVERYGFASMAFNLLDEEDRKQLEKLGSESLDFACNTKNRYTCLLTEHSKLLRLDDHSRDTILAYYKDPAMLKKDMKFFYPRKEPYTGAEYYICYLNVSWLRSNPDLTDEEISQNPGTYIENDWGLGVAYYSLYMTMLASGNFEPLRKDFAAFAKMWDYLRIFHDWACMAAGYAEHGAVWSEGANYCAYESFVNLAEIAQDEEKRRLALYLGSQNMALRFAIYRSSQKYFHKYFGVEPYAMTKAFREEHSPAYQFQGCPTELDKGRLRHWQMHTFITEGAFPSVLRHCSQFLPEEHRFVAGSYLENFLDKESSPPGPAYWSRTMAPTLILLNMAEDPSIDPAIIREKLARAKENKCLIPEWRDIGTFSTFHPENLYESMILARLEARDHKLTLEHWCDLRLTQTLWDEDKALLRAEFTGKEPVIVCEVKEAPSSVSVKHRLCGKTLYLYPEDDRSEIVIAF